MQDIVFRGLSAPLRLTGSDAALPVLRDIAAGWPVDAIPVDPSRAPFYSITSKADEPLLWCECHVDDRPRRWFDAVNAICDVVSALALALTAECPELICLHAAGVEMAGRLVVFPNIRKAGKSTLSAALAQAGHPVFSDDVIPVFFTEGPCAHGLAMGIAPRLRLPLPPTLGQGFHDWAGHVSGPANGQYRYLRVEGQPPHGATLPIGAFVILDRQDEPVSARLDPVAPDTAMDALLFQNFTRDRHSGDILHLMAATLSDRPVYRLTYSDLESAVACLEATFAAWPDDGIDTAPEPPLVFRLADTAPEVPPPLTGESSVRQRPGSIAVSIGQTLYLADAEGRAIHRMDPLAAAIWALIVEPMPVRDLIDLTAEAFPDAAPDQVAIDIEKLLARLNRAGLITAQD